MHAVLADPVAQWLPIEARVTDPFSLLGLDDITALEQLLAPTDQSGADEHDNDDDQDEVGTEDGTEA